MKESNVDALFAFSGPNIFYFSGARIGPSDRLAVVIIPVEGEVIIIAPGFEGDRIRSEKLIGEVRTWEEDEDPFLLVSNTFKKIGVSKSRIAIDDTLWFRVYEKMKKASPETTFINGEDIIKKTRWIKSPDEIEFIEKACTFVSKGIELALKELKAGMTEMDFSALISEMINKAGNVRGGALVQSGPNASFPHNPTSNRVLQNGDAVVIDSGCNVEQYYSDISRTLMIGDVEDEIKKCWQIVKDAQKAAIDSVKPGLTAESIDKAARDVIDKAGYGKYFTHRTGHGLGLEGHEHPYLVNGNKEILQPGMTFTIEPGIYIPNRFGMRIEDDIAVTEDGSKILSEMKQDWEITL